MSTRRSWALRGLKVAIGLVLGGVFAVLAVMGVDWSELGATLAGADWRWFAGMLAFLCMSYFVKAARWRELLAVKERLPYPVVFRVISFGFMMNKFVPMHAGELTSRPYLISVDSKKISFEFALATTLSAKLLDLLMTGAFLVVSSFVFEIPSAWLAAALKVIGGGAVVGTIGAVVVARFHRRAVEALIGKMSGRLLNERTAAAVTGSAGRFLSGLAVLGHGRTLCKAALLSLVTFGVLLAMTSCALRAVGLQSGPLVGMLILGLMGIAFVIPSPPSYAGTIHFFIMSAILVAGIGAEHEALSVAILIHGGDVLIVSALGLLAMPWLRLRRADVPNSSLQVSRDESDTARAG